MDSVRALGSLALFAGLLPAVCGADFTTYIGDQFSYGVTAMATDAAGNTYVTGGRSVGDVFVTKLDASASIVFTTTFGGKGTDSGNAIAVDPAGKIWVGGITSSDDFPLRDAIQTVSSGAGHDWQSGFLVKLAPDGTVVYSSYFGGLQGSSSVNGVATDASGNVYVTGTTGSPDGNEAFGAFVTKLDPSGSNVIYAVHIAGAKVDCSGGSSCFLATPNTSGAGIAVDPAGEAFITGNTNTIDLPVTPGGLAGYGAFAAKINAAGNGLAYLTYLSPPGGMDITDYGPSESATATAIAVDASGNSYLTGFTNDSTFPATPGGYQTTLNTTGDPGEQINAFAMKLNPSGAPVWATFLGGPGPDGASSIGVDSSGDVWLTGGNAAGFPSTSPFAGLVAGYYLAELSADGSKLLNSTSSATAGQALAFDASGVLHVASQSGLVSTVTPGQPPTPRMVGVVNAAQGQVAGRIAPGEIISIFGYGIGPATPASATPKNGAFPRSLGGVQVLVNGAPIPLLYASAYQINAEVPSPLNGDHDYNATMQVINGSAMLPEYRVSVDSSIFVIFTNPDGSAAAINQDGTVNSESNPAPAGTIVSIWATGYGTAGPPADGSITATANNWCSYCQLQISGVGPETVEYAGSSPGLIDGLMQINFVAQAEPRSSGSTQAFFTFSLSGQSTEWFIWVAPTN